MGWAATRKLRQSVNGLGRVLAIGLLTATRGIELRATTPISVCGLAGVSRFRTQPSRLPTYSSGASLLADSDGIPVKGKGAVGICPCCGTRAGR
jgi:hypothetical protein